MKRIVSIFLPHASITLIFAMWMGFFVLTRVSVFADADTGWHLAAGDLIRTTGSIPTADPWSFTTTGTFWFNLSWFYDWALSHLFEWWGYGGLYALTLLTYAAVGTLQGTHAYRNGANLFVTLFACYIGMWAAYQGMMLRPHMMTLLFVVAFYQLLSRNRRAHSSRALLLLPLLMVLWVNTHGGFMMGLFLILVFAAEAYLEKRKAAFRTLLGVCAVCLLATLVNPYGLHVYEGAARTLGSPMQAYIAEWQPLNVNIPAHHMTLLLILFLLWFSGFRNPNIPLADRMLAVAFVLGMATSVRYSILGAPLLIPYIAYCHTERIKDEPDTFLFHRWNAKLEAFCKHPVFRFGMVCLCAMFVTYTVTPFPRDMQFGGAVGFSKEQQLKEEITYIQTHLKDQKLLTFYDFGGHLIFQTRGGIKVYVDGRERTAYPLSLIEDNILFMKSYGWGPGVRDMFARYGITALMIPKGMELEQHFRKNADWKLAFEGPNASIFSKVEYSHAR